MMLGSGKSWGPAAAPGVGREPPRLVARQQLGR